MRARFRSTSTFVVLALAAAVAATTARAQSVQYRSAAGVDYRSHATEYLARTEAALAQVEDRYGRLRS